MSTYVLVPGAGSDHWYWHRVEPLLRARGHDVVAVDLPCDDDSAGLDVYVDRVVEAIGDHDDVVLVAQSMGGLSAPVACTRAPVRLLVLVNAMIPSPGESGGEWWSRTGATEAFRELAVADGRDPDRFDDDEVFLHDVPPALVASGAAHVLEQSEAPFAAPSPLERWPDVPTRVLVSEGDRCFPSPFQRRISLERLGIEPDELPGGHLPALAHPEELVERLEAYRSAVA